MKFIRNATLLHEEISTATTTISGTAIVGEPESLSGCGRVDTSHAGTAWQGIRRKGLFGAAAR